MVSFRLWWAVGGPLIVRVAFVAVVLAFSACSRNRPPSGARSAGEGGVPRWALAPLPEDPRWEAGASAAIDYLANAIVAASAASQHHSAEWDDLIRRLAHQYATTLKTEFRDNEMCALARDAINRGCKDPFVRYIGFKYRDECFDLSADADGRAGVELVEELHSQSYPPLVQAYAANRAYYVWRKGHPEETTVAKSLADKLWQSTFDTLDDQSIPEWMSRPCGRMISLVWSDTPEERSYVTEKLIEGFTNRYGDCSSGHLLRGNEKIQIAWDARGGGYASTVTESGRKTFRAELAVAKEELETAWQADPRSIGVAESMITVCMGLGLPREEMEKWFQRGLSTEQDVSGLCSNKVYYLAGRWYGSDEEQLVFSRECLARAQYGWQLALMLWRTQKNIRDRDTSAADYFSQPKVWEDIRLSFSTFLTKNPDAEDCRMQYCYHAWLAKDWPLVHEQLALFDPAQASFNKIGGRSVYDRIVADDKAHSN